MLFNHFLLALILLINYAAWPFLFFIGLRDCVTLSLWRFVCTTQWYIDICLMTWTVRSIEDTIYSTTRINSQDFVLTIVNSNVAKTNWVQPARWAKPSGVLSAAVSSEFTNGSEGGFDGVHPGFWLASAPFFPTW